MIDIDPTWKRIGVSLSGGADSALLTYLICKNTDADIYLNHQIRMWRTRPWQEYVAENVKEWFVNNFSNNFFMHKNLVPPELEESSSDTLILDEYGKEKPGNRIILRSFNEYIANKYNLDALFGGVNLNPDVHFEGALEERNTGHIPAYYEHDGIAICHPFVHTRKDWIIKQYYNYDILDLLSITRSCEGEFEGLDYTTYEPYETVPECGKCFWCKERQWGIDEATK